MALVTTIGSKRANSWITAVQATTYLTDSGLYTMTAWNALTTTQKEDRLIYACKIMKSQFNFVGWPVYTNQALPFPRRFSLDDTIEIPEDIKKAQAFIAYAIVHKRFVDIFNPAEGFSGSPDISSLSLLGISIGVASSNIPAQDNSALEALAQSEHMHIYLLLQDYVTQVTCIPAPKGPSLLDEVA